MAALDDDEGGFGQGIAVGIAISAVLVHVYFVAIGGDWATMYQEFGSKLPLLTRLTISIGWQIGVPAIAAIAIGALIIRRPRPVWIYVAVAGLIVIAAACTVHFPSLPLTELAGSIKAE